MGVCVLCIQFCNWVFKFEDVSHASRCQFVFPVISLHFGCFCFSCFLCFFRDCCLFSDVFVFVISCFVISDFVFFVAILVFMFLGFVCLSFVLF